MAAHPADPEKKAKTKFLVETTTWPPAIIGKKVGVATSTVHRWIAENEWKRPNVAVRPPMTPERLAATARGFELGMRAADLAVLNGRCQNRIYQFATEHGWRRASRQARDAQAPPVAARPEIAAIETALLSDPLERAELIPLVERATAIAAADALTGRDPRAEERLAWLARAAAIVKSLPAREARTAAEDLCHPDGIAPFSFIETDRLIEEIAQRFEEFCRTEPSEELPADAGAPAA
jgi:hypothetical protein